jgi:hypothetical protein
VYHLVMEERLIEAKREMAETALLLAQSELDWTNLRDFGMPPLYQGTSDDYVVKITEDSFRHDRTLYFKERAVKDLESALYFPRMWKAMWAYFSSPPDTPSMVLHNELILPKWLPRNM